MRGLKDRVALVTGGARGIGRAICERLGEEGSAVAVSDVNGEGAEEVAGAIRDAGGKAMGLAMDVTDYAAVAKSVAAVNAELGPIDVLVNNAGWDKTIFFLETDTDFWRQVVDLNLYGPMNLCHIVAPGMVERGRGRIINISSDAGRVGSSGEAVYSACKGGVIAFSKTLAREFARSGVTVNAVCPGPTDTALLASVDATGKIVEALKRAIPMRRLGQPVDFGGMIAFLASDDASYITGQTISISGGLTMS